MNKYQLLKELNWDEAHILALVQNWSPPTFHLSEKMDHPNVRPPSRTKTTTDHPILKPAHNYAAHAACAARVKIDDWIFRN